ncbi:MAG: hypothetical protein KF690_11640 [Bacteroidetes bacterium]|nr:hypothetical protein [Bacteroidota bacterium]
MQNLRAFLLIGFLALTTHVSAQSSRSYGTLFVGSGANMMNFASLNQRLTDNDLPPVSNIAMNANVGGYGVLDGRVLVGAEGTLYFSRNNQEGIINDMVGGYGIFQVGYSIVRKRRLEFYPLVGVGFGSLAIRLRDTRPDGYFQNYFDELPNVRELIGRGPMIQLAAGVQYRLSQRNGYFIGLRGGYVNMGNSGWRFSGGQLIDGPATAGSNFFLNLTFGMFLHDLY